MDSLDVRIVGFGGDRRFAFVADLQRRLAESRSGRAESPPLGADCVSYAGHVGISLDGGVTILAFNPKVQDDAPAWRMLEDLRAGKCFPGIVTNDTALFSLARQRGLELKSFAVKIPACDRREFRLTLDAERKSSKYTYGFPLGSGDCNCITWIERLGVPLLTGFVDEWLQSSARPAFFGE